MSAIIRTHENYLRSKCPKLDHMFMHARSVAHTETELIESASLRSSKLLLRPRSVAM